MARKAVRVNRRDELRWVERVAAFCHDQYGLPPITGRILGWLMIADPAEQSAAEIAAAIGASRASLTTNMRLLTATGLVHRRAGVGTRTASYRVEDDAWEEVIRRRFTSLKGFLAITEEGMDLVGRDTERAARIRAAHDIYEWAGAIFANAPAPPRRRRTR